MGSNNASVHVIYQKQRITINNLDLNTLTLSEFKKMCARCAEEPNSDNIKLLCAGALMKDDKSVLASYGVRNGSRIMMLSSKPAVLPGTSVHSNSNKERKNKKTTSSEDENSIKRKKRKYGNSGIQEASEDAGKLISILYEYQQSISPPHDAEVNKEYRLIISDMYACLFNVGDDNVKDGLEKIIESTFGRPEDEPHLPSSLLSKQEINEKMYRYLNEKLMRIILKLDAIDTGGNQEVRLERKQWVGRIQGLLSLIDKLKVFNNNNNN